MNSPLVLLAVVAVAGAVSGLPACMCPRNYDPVCASNGVMFSNQCMLRCHNAETNDNLVVVDKEQCHRSLDKDVCICTMEYMPVCGSNHVTYGNKCAFNCAAKKDSTLKKVGDFACEAALFQSVEQNDDLCVCTYEYMPVCGSDHVTYPNKCTYECAARKDNSLKMVSTGVCGQEQKTSLDFVPPVCTLEYAPVCGSNHVTYGNKCMFKYAASQNNGLTMLHTGECETQDAALFGSIQSFCTLEYAPVCGSNHVTYGNKCFFNYAASQINGLTMLHTGECETQNAALYGSIKYVCTLEYAPICGSDHVTYPNKCVFTHAAAEQKGLTMLHQGECENKDTALFGSFYRNGECVCTREYMPMCGSDGVTYNNLCLFQCAQMKDNKLAVTSYGRCNIPETVNLLEENDQNDMCICTREYMPVCGSDHVTYANECLFRCAAKKDQSLTMVYNHSC